MNSQAQGDFAMNRAMALNLHPSISRRLILGYDIWCQYGVHLLERFKKFDHLTFPDFLTELTGPDEVMVSTIATYAQLSDV